MLCFCNTHKVIVYAPGLKYNCRALNSNYIHLYIYCLVVQECTEVLSLKYDACDITNEQNKVYIEPFRLQDLLDIMQSL